MGKHQISPIVVSTIVGHSGGGMFPLTLFPSYQSLMRIMWETRTTSLTKSSTYQKHVGNFIPHKPWTWRFVQRLENDGLLNAYGLTNDGISFNAQKIASAYQNGFRVIPNFYPQFAKGRYEATMETMLTIKSLYIHLDPGFWALELNLSCPNAKEKIKANIEDALACAKAIKQQYPKLCLIAKISIVHPYEFAQELIHAGVDIIHAINTIPYDLVYPDGPPSPLMAVGDGGVSGGPAFRQAFNYNRGLRKAIKAPIIMGCGVMDSYGARSLFEIAGADAVSLCTVCRLNPKEAIKIIEHYAT